MSTENSPSVAGQTPDGNDVLAIIIRGGSLEASCMTWGASIRDLHHSAVPHLLVLGSADLQAWFEDLRYYGSVVGPVANRIAGGCFTLNGNTIDTDRNENGVTTLHGGSQGFGERNWHLQDYTASSCKFVLQHPDGLGGFPGNVQVSVIYALDESDTLTIRIEGKTDRTTYFNPVFHGYWNLDGNASLENHRLQIDADTCLPVYDGVQLIIDTTEPGLQVYSGGGIDTKPWRGHGGTPYTRNAGLAIEPQCWPDTPDQEGYPDVVLQSGELMSR